MAFKSGGFKVRLSQPYRLVEELKIRLCIVWICSIIKWAKNTAFCFFHLTIFLVFPSDAPASRTNNTGKYRIATQNGPFLRNFLKFFWAPSVFTLKSFTLTAPPKGKFCKILYFSNFCIYWLNGKSDPASKSNSATYFWG